MFHDYYPADWIQWCKWQLSVSSLLHSWMNTKIMVQATVMYFMTFALLNEYNGAIKMLVFPQVKKWVGSTGIKTWEPCRDPAQIPTESPRIMTGFSGIWPEYLQDPPGIDWDPSGIKTQDFAGSPLRSRRDPTSLILTGSQRNKNLGFCGISVNLDGILLKSQPWSG